VDPVVKPRDDKNSPELTLISLTIADIRGLSTVVSAAEVHRCPAFGHPAARATA